MKRIITLLIAIMMLILCAACSNNADAPEQSQDDIIEQPVSDDAVEDDPSTDNSSTDTVGQTLLADFKTAVANGGSAEEIANIIIANENIEFSPVAGAIEPGLLTGFGNTEITGFKEGAMFAPMIGTIPFVGYIFILDDASDVQAFKTNLEQNANPRWNVCTEAEEVTIESVDNYIFFLMSPMSFEG